MLAGLDTTKLIALISVVISTIVSGVVTTGLNIGKEYIDRRRDATINSLYIALLLEIWASKCAEVCLKYDRLQNDRNQQALRELTLPSLPDFRREADLKPLPIRLTAEVMTHEINIKSDMTYLESLPEDIRSTETNTLAIFRGREAMQLSSNIRSRYDLQSPRARFVTEAKNALYSKYAEQKKVESQIFWDEFLQHIKILSGRMMRRFGINK